MVISVKRLRSVAQSTAHHGVSGLCHLHPHLGEDCQRKGIQVAKINLLNISEQQNSQVEGPIALASNVLRQQFEKILGSEGGTLDQLEVAIALFEFTLGPWPTACMVSLKTIEGKKVESAVGRDGKSTAVFIQPPNQPNDYLWDQGRPADHRPAG